MSDNWFWPGLRGRRYECDILSGLVASAQSGRSQVLVLPRRRLHLRELGLGRSHRRALCALGAGERRVGGVELGLRLVLVLPGRGLHLSHRRLSRLCHRLVTCQRLLVGGESLLVVRDHLLIQGALRRAGAGSAVGIGVGGVPLELALVGGHRLLVGLDHGERPPEVGLRRGECLLIDPPDVTRALLCGIDLHPRRRHRRLACCLRSRDLLLGHSHRLAVGLGDVPEGDGGGVQLRSGDGHGSRPRLHTELRAGHDRLVQPLVVGQGRLRGCGLRLDQPKRSAPCR